DVRVPALLRVGALHLAVVLGAGERVVVAALAGVVVQQGHAVAGAHHHPERLVVQLQRGRGQREERAAVDDLVGGDRPGLRGGGGGVVPVLLEHARGGPVGDQAGGGADLAGGEHPCNPRLAGGVAKDGGVEEPVQGGRVIGAIVHHGDGG